MLSWWIGVLLVASAGASAVCPHHCSCFTDPDGYVSANCSTLTLGAVESSPVELLSLQPRYGGYPTRLAPRSFLAFPKLKFLWAVNCSVLNLPTDVFHGLNYVIRIDLSYNKIRHLNGAVFKKLGSLTTLRLRANPLELTPWDTIVSDSLQELDLGYCGLRTIPYGTFVGVPRLSRLYLDGNELRTFSYNLIPAGLRYVNLARNRISNVPTDVLSTMSYLRKLDLSKNPVNCTCNLLIMQDWLSGQGIILDNGVTCSEPSQYAGMRLSKINENELCTMEEVKRHRMINDIQSYGDSKSHRTHNMIHDPDFQSDQPSGQIYADVLFHDDGTRGMTHMELSDKHYPPLPSDFSDENNKLASSKQELHSTGIDLAPPTQEAKKIENESSKEDLMEHDVHSDPLKNLDSVEDEIHPTEHNVELNSTNLDDSIPLHSKLPDVEHTTDMTSWEKNNVIVSDDLLSNSLAMHFNDTNSSKSAHEEMADEGYSPVFNISEIMSDEPEGSGSDSVDVETTNHTKEETSTPSFLFPSSSSGEDYQHYDTNHDYSAEVSSTTEQITVLPEEEGSGQAENETIPSSSAVFIDNEDNETTTQLYFRIDTSSDKMFTVPTEVSPEDYNTSSVQLNSSSEYSTTEEPTTGIYLDFSSVSSAETSSAEPSSSSSSNDSIFGITEVPTSSSAEPSSTEESSTPALPIIPANIPSSTEAPTTSTESPSSSSIPDIIPEIEVETAAPSTTESRTTPTSVRPVFQTSSSTLAPTEEVEVIREISGEVKSEIMAQPKKEEVEKDGKTEAAQTTLTYVIGGLLVALVLLIITTVLCRKVIKMKPCATKKKVRLPQDPEANHGTEMQDMLLPKPPENGIKIISGNGTQNGKDVKEEEMPVLDKDWEDKVEPIETVTARMSILAGPQTPVFIHKTLA